MANLTRTDAQARAALVDVTAYTVDLDLSGGDRGSQTTFGSTVTIGFGCREPGASTFLDLAAEQVHEITLNGRSLDPAAVSDSRVTLPDLRDRNEVTVRATMAYSNDGQGLHRALDPSDGRYYVYGHLFLDAAPRVFGCFDQPDLKAPYTLTVTAPQGWTVLGNGVATRSGETRWDLATTHPLATYFVTVCAGPYASVTDHHDGIPLGIHARASLATQLREQAPQMLEVTRAAFDYYHRLFGIRYPFGAYHQVFVPEFNAGAMENPGCVTFRDSYIFRGAATEDEVLARSNTIAHEMAHMWFGDLVTMQWWDDLWLNESFAEYMAHRTLVAATDFQAAWVDSAMYRKTWGYAAERTPSTHPVAGSPAPDADTALQNFDGISYAKGAAVLRQLIAHIGDDAFVTGISAYLREHAFGNAGLSDFLTAMETASGEDLGPWAGGWLRTAGLDTIGAVVGEGRLDLTRTPPAEHPADRPHTLDVAGWSGGTRTLYAEAQLAQDAATLPVVPSGPVRLLIPNASDLTWARVRLDAASVAALPEELPAVPEPVQRAVVWVALADALAVAELDPQHLLRVFETAWPVEEEPSVLGKVAWLVGSRLLGVVLRPEDRPDARRRVAGAARQRLDAAAPGSSQSVTAARLLAQTTDDTDLLTRWAEGVDRPLALVDDVDFRWTVLRALALLDAVDEATIAAAEEQDRSLQGKLGALAARAARPTEAAKEWAWDQLTGDHGRSNYELNALAGAFWAGGDPDLLRPYVDRFHEEVPALSGRIGQDALARVASLAYPGAIAEPATDEATTARLDRGGLSPAVRRALVDQQSLLREVLASRAAYPPVTG
ncbi:aminopeptidase N [Ornithinicoccus hortensis]|uniref:Aminopeptidase N n=1 Tax=Ornithinicoccus hortensis TaxID=82346 RepID=A0A542YPC9_9MICO|nr:aminopeptidase N [Ornithinicoccus hortensis]TQL49963.1 aminopeptidase N [Ornithinicoccus hortensis]